MMEVLATPGISGPAWVMAGGQGEAGAENGFGAALSRASADAENPASAGLSPAPEFPVATLTGADAVPAQAAKPPGWAQAGGVQPEGLEPGLAEGLTAPPAVSAVPAPMPAATGRSMAAAAAPPPAPAAPAMEAESSAVAEADPIPPASPLPASLPPVTAPPRTTAALETATADTPPADPQPAPTAADGAVMLLPRAAVDIASGMAGGKQPAPPMEIEAPETAFLPGVAPPPIRAAGMASHAATGHAATRAAPHATVPQGALPDAPPTPVENAPPVPEAPPLPEQSRTPAGNSTISALPPALPGPMLQPLEAAATEASNPRPSATIEVTPGSAASAPPPPPPARQVATMAIALAFAPAMGQFRVALEPAELGRVEITVRRLGEAHQVLIVAERPETLALLQRDRAELDKALAESGVSVEDSGIGFALESGQDGAAHEGTQRDGARARPRITPAPASIPTESRHAPRGLLDLNV